MGGGSGGLPRECVNYPQAVTTDFLSLLLLMASQPRRSPPPALYIFSELFGEHLRAFKASFTHIVGSGRYDGKQTYRPPADFGRVPALRSNLCAAGHPGFGR